MQPEWKNMFGKWLKDLTQDEIDHLPHGTKAISEEGVVAVKTNVNVWQSKPPGEEDLWLRRLWNNEQAIYLFPLIIYVPKQEKE